MLYVRKKVIFLPRIPTFQPNVDNRKILVQKHLHVLLRNKISGLYGIVRKGPPQAEMFWGIAYHQLVMGWDSRHFFWYFDGMGKRRSETW